MVADDLAVGSTVTSGQPLLEVVAPAPDVVIELSRDQRDVVPLDAQVEVSANGRTWLGRTSEPTSSGEGGLLLPLVGRDGRPLCPANCRDVIPFEGETFLPVRVVVVPSTTGPIVPASAVRVTPDGSTIVTRADGEQVPVDVVASDGGHAVIQGLDVGTRIELFPAGDATDTRESATSDQAETPDATPSGTN